MSGRHEKRKRKQQKKETYQMSTQISGGVFRSKFENERWQQNENKIDRLKLVSERTKAFMDSVLKRLRQLSCDNEGDVKEIDRIDSFIDSMELKMKSLKRVIAEKRKEFRQAENERKSRDISEQYQEVLNYLGIGLPPKRELFNKQEREVFDWLDRVSRSLEALQKCKSATTLDTHQSVALLYEKATECLSLFSEFNAGSVEETGYIDKKNDSSETLLAPQPLPEEAIKDQDNLSSNEASAAIGKDEGGFQDNKCSDCEILESEIEDLKRVHAQKEKDWEEKIEKIYGELKNLRRENAFLKDRLNSKDDSHGRELVKKLLSLCSKNDLGKIKTLEQALKLIEFGYHKDVDIFESAWKSARDSMDFEKPHEAFYWTFVLMTKYLSIMKAGGGDAQAKQVFPDGVFAGNEHESTDMRKREFEGVEMKKHLRIGNGTGTSTCWRCHFKYDADEKKILIGHYGRHLDPR